MRQQAANDCDVNMKTHEYVSEVKTWFNPKFLIVFFKVKTTNMINNCYPKGLVYCGKKGSKNVLK